MSLSHRQAPDQPLHDLAQQLQRCAGMHDRGCQQPLLQAL